MNSWWIFGPLLLLLMNIYTWVVIYKSFTCWFVLQQYGILTPPPNVSVHPYASFRRNAFWMASTLYPSRIYLKIKQNNWIHIKKTILFLILMKKFKPYRLKFCDNHLYITNHLYNTNESHREIKLIFLWCY